VDLDGDGFTEDQGDVDDSDLSVYPGAPELCGDGVDNDSDGLADCLDNDCNADCGADNVQSFRFDTNSEGFEYRDDLFRGTGHPAYASGSYDPANGLAVTLGGIDSTKIRDGRSGGWSRTFAVMDESTINIRLRYRLTIAGEYESDEYSQVLVSVDDQLIGMDGRDYLVELRGSDQNTPVQDSGWHTTTLQVFLLPGTHTLAVGVWNNQKTGALETTQAYFDDIEIITETFIATDAASLNGIICRANACGFGLFGDGYVWEADRFLMNAAVPAKKNFSRLSRILVRL
jgi:hypothetical protein